MTDPDGFVSHSTYDQYGDKISSTNGVGDRATSTYNVIGWNLTTVSPKGNVPGANPNNFATTYSYNNFGQAISTKDPLNHTTRQSYDAEHNLVSTTDAKGNTTRYGFDAADEQISIRKADGSVTKTTYWPDGTVENQIDANGHITHSDYDALARVVAVTDPLGHITKSAYDLAGNPISVTDAMGQVTSKTYDAGNELTSVSYSDGKTPNVTSITYDADGQRVGQIDGTGSWSWTWDSLHRVVQVVEGSNGTVGYGYNLRNLVTSITYPGSQTVSRSYDAAGKWTGVTDWLGNTTTFAYDANSNLVTETFPASTKLVDSFGFNRADQMVDIVDVGNDNSLVNLLLAWIAKLSDNLLPSQLDQVVDLIDAVGGNALFSADYLRDPNGQVTSDSSSAAPSGPAYAYNSVNELCRSGNSTNAGCSSQSNKGNTSFAYDPGANLTTNGPATQSFNAGNELCWSANGSSSNSCSSPPTGATSYTYDLNGNRTSASSLGSQVTTSRFNQANELTAYSKRSTAATYSYNGDGLRMSKTVDGATSPFVWDPSSTVPVLLSDQAHSFVYGPGGLPLEQITGSSVLWLHHDQLGSTRLVTSANGSMAGKFWYSPYGVLTPSSGAPATPMLYAGQYIDGESSLYYLQARYYDPASAQFMTVDPAVAITHSPYGYVAGNPLNAADPAGLGDCPNGVAIPFTDLCINNPLNLAQDEQNFHNNTQLLNTNFQIGPFMISPHDVMANSIVFSLPSAVMSADSAAHGEGSWLQVPTDALGALPLSGQLEKIGAQFLADHGLIAWGSRLWNASLFSWANGAKQFLIHMTVQFGRQVASQLLASGLSGNC